MHTPPAVGDAVVYRDTFSRPHTYTVAALTDTGLRAELVDAADVPLGWAVMVYDLEPSSN